MSGESLCDRTGCASQEGLSLLHLFGIVDAVLCSVCRREFIAHEGLDESADARARVWRHYQIAEKALVGPKADPDQAMRLSDDFAIHDRGLRRQIKDWLSTAPVGRGN